MEPEIIPGFDCLEHKWRVQAEIYEKIKDMTTEEQIAFFRNAAETGPFAEFMRRVGYTRSRGKPEKPGMCGEGGETG